MGKPWADHGQGYDESPTRATQLATSSWSFSLVGLDGWMDGEVFTSTSDLPERGGLETLITL
jgi:hypothetical protein